MFAKIPLLTLALCTIAQAMDCGIHLNKNDVLTATINKCVATNKTLQDLWDMNPMSSESDSSSSEEQPAGVDGKMDQIFRTKRNTTVQESSNETASNTTTEEPVSENCIIQCIFDDLQLTDGAGYPAHQKILQSLLQNATKEELRDFLQDTTEGCFQMLDREVTMDPCSYSVKLLTCLADKGKGNCSDWPVGDLPKLQ